MTRTWAWWHLAEEFCRRITMPKIDVAAADRDVDALIRESRLWSCGQSFASKSQAAWLDSTCRVFAGWVTSHWR